MTGSNISSLNDDGGLALLDSEVEDGSGSLRRGALVRDDLQERHLVDRGEVVQAHNVLGALAGLGKLGNGDGRRVAGDDAVRRHDRLHGADHLPESG